MATRNARIMGRPLRRQILPAFPGADATRPKGGREGASCRPGGVARRRACRSAAFDLPSEEPISLRFRGGEHAAGPGVGAELVDLPAGRIREPEIERVE